ncbi:hypothetical protein EP331_00260 [bacterium]|nr:MAG: hypothetical protein EP331_00260 [bacterium]
MLQIKDHGELSVLNYVKANLLKLSTAIGDNLDQDYSRLEMIAEDLIELYHYDSIEDIRECLKKGRRGDYGFGHHKRGYVTMLLLREWMEKHLEEKAIIREKDLAIKKIELEKVENFDAKKFYEEGVKFLAAQNEREKKRNKFSSATYEEIKHRYFNENKKEDENGMD